MRLQPEAFNRLLNDIGQRFAWRRAFACPCVSPASGAPRHDCPHCLGKGRAWAAPVEGVAGVVGRDQMRDFAQVGVVDAGDVMLSIPSDSPLYELGQYDRLVSLNRSEPFSQVLVRGRDTRLRYPVLSIERATYIDASGALVEAAAPSVTADGLLSWGAGAPPAGVQVSLTGRRRPEFFVYAELPFDRPHHFGRELPRRVVLRRFDLYGR